MYAYAQRYDCPRVVLIYPQTAGMREPLRASFRLEDCDKTVVCATVNLHRDLSGRTGRNELAGELAETVAGSVLADAGSCWVGARGA